MSLKSPLQASKSAAVEQYLDLVKQLHRHYHRQLDAALVSANKFQKCQKYFLRALRLLSPKLDYVTSLAMLESLIKTDEKEANDPDDDIAFARTMIRLFQDNMQNFRLLRQDVKMNILATLKQMPQKEESDAQTRTREDVEVLLSSWGILVSTDTDLTRLEHPDIQCVENLFQDEHERKCLEGILSLIPKLVDLANRLDFILTKYYLKTPHSTF